MASATAETESPYKGLAPYTESDSEWFFGRDSQVRIVATNLMSARITVLYAGSGVGKTSVLRAGVVPNLRNEARRGIGPTGQVDFAVALHNRWQDDPIGSLLDSVEAAVDDALKSDQRSKSMERRAHLDDTLYGYAGALDADILLIFDQFEEWFLYHGGSTGEGSAGDELVRTMARQDLPIHYLISLREDALARLDWFKGRVPGLFENLLRLRHLDRAAGRQAIEGPIERHNAGHGDTVEIEPAVVVRVLDEVRAGAVVVGNQGQGAVDGDGGGLASVSIEAPFLQLVMTRLWDEERAQGSRCLRAETLDNLGAADRIVRSYLDESMHDLDPDDQALAADSFNHLVTPSGTKIAYSVDDLAQYTGSSPEHLGTLLGTLAGLRILRPVAPPPGQDRSTRFEIFHDVLAPAVLDWRTRYLHERSRKQLALGLGQKVRRTRAMAAVVVGILALTAATWFIYQQNQNEKRARNEVRSDRLASQAVALLNSNPATAVQTALEAVGVASSPTTEGALRATVPPYLRVAAVLQGPFGRPAEWAGFAAKGSELTFSQGVAVLRDISTGDRLLRLPKLVGADGRLLHLPTLVAAALSQPGNLLAAVDTGHRASLWDLRTQTEVAPLGAHVTGAVISGDEKRILTWGSRAPVIWTAAGDAVAKLPTSNVVAADITRNHHRAVTLSKATLVGSRYVRLWDLENRPEPILSTTIIAPSDTDALAISSTGRFVLMRGILSVRLHDLRTGRTYRLLGSNQPLNSATFDASGTRVVTASEDGSARIYNAVTGALTATLANNSGSVTDAVFSHSGALVATAGNDNKARIWNATTGIPSLILSGHSAAVKSVAFSKNDTLLVTVGADHRGATRVWKVAPAAKTVVPGPVFDASVSPTNPNLVAIASLTSGAYLWTGGEELPRSLHTAASSGVSFSTNGNYMVTTTQELLSPPHAFVWKVSATGADLRGRVTIELGKRTTIYPHPSFSPNDRSVLLATNHGAVIWRWQDPGRKSLSRPFGVTRVSGGVAYGVYAASYSPNGLELATSGHGGVQIWEARVGGKMPVAVSGMGLGTSSVVTVAFDPSGRYIATGDEAGSVAVWAVKSAYPRTIGPPLNIPAIPTDVDFSPDGRLMVIASTDGTARVWNWRAGNTLATLQLHAGATRTAEYLPRHPNEILSAGDDGIVEYSGCPTCVPLPALERLARRHLAKFGLRG